MRRLLAALLFIVTITGYGDGQLKQPFLGDGTIEGKSPPYTKENHQLSQVNNLSIGFLSPFAPAPNLPDTYTKVTQATDNGTDKSSTDWWVAFFTGCLVIVGLFQLWLFIWQLRLIRKSLIDAEAAADTAKMIAEATMAGQRAYVIPIPYSAPVEGGGFNFGVIWNNTGNLATREMCNHIDYEIIDGNTDLSENFKFPDDMAPLVSGTMLGPKQNVYGPYIPQNGIISISDIEAIQRGEKTLFIFGWAKYFDGFSTTPKHITKFCFSVKVTGNPKMPFVFPPYKRYNFAD